MEPAPLSRTNWAQHAPHGLSFVSGLSIGYVKRNTCNLFRSISTSPGMMSRFGQMSASKHVMKMGVSATFRLWLRYWFCGLATRTGEPSRSSSCTHNVRTCCVHLQPSQKIAFAEVIPNSGKLDAVGAWNTLAYPKTKFSGRKMNDFPSFPCDPTNVGVVPLHLPCCKLKCRAHDSSHGEWTTCNQLRTCH